MWLLKIDSSGCNTEDEDGYGEENENENEDNSENDYSDNEGEFGELVKLGAIVMKHPL